MTTSKRLVLSSLAIFVLAELLFLFNLSSPLKPNFDEFHYIPAAKAFLTHGEMRNWEHPPLAKLLIAPGIALFGDQPFGWRFMSTIFGSLTLVGMFFLGLAIFADFELSLWIVLISAVNHLVYVQARIAMLDTFMVAFLVWALAAFSMAWRPAMKRPISRNLLAATGLAVGLASACKWFGVVCWVGFFGAFAGIKAFQYYSSRKRRAAKRERKDTWYDPRLFAETPVWEGAILLGLLPVIVYFLTFIPLVNVKTPLGELHGLGDLLHMQKEMWLGQLRVVNKHPYMSQWYEWPLLNRPIWYAFDREGVANEWVRGVVLLGNPLVMWSGVLAILVCIYSFFQKRSRESFLILFFYGLFYGSWIVIPRKIAFYYYYYPAGMVLSLALAYVFHHGEYGKYFKMKWARWSFWGASFLLFVYFFPVLSGWRIPSNEYIRWMWFMRWI